jgi:hypothetical protein
VAGNGIGGVDQRSFQPRKGHARDIQRSTRPVEQNDTPSRHIP